MSPEYAFDTAVMMMREGRREEAAAICWEVIRINPKHADAWAMRARIEAEAGRYANAMLHHAMALQAAPDRHDLWCNRAIDAMSARMYRESEEGFVRSLMLQDSYEGHYNYGNLLSAMVRVDEAVEQFKLAMKIDDKTNSQIHANLGVAMIAQGKWREGFNAYRHRFNAPGFPPRPRFNYPQWHGEPLGGKTIMLYVEQGFGDEIMSLRFASIIKARGARVILAVRPPMFRLARTPCPGPHSFDAVILMYDAPPWEPDYMCSLLDVAAYVDIDPETVPLKHGYLRAEDRGFKLKFPPGLNVGICWASGKRDLQLSVAETAKLKTLSFQQISAPLARPGVNLVSLQQNHNDGAALRDLGVYDPMAGVTDFADTAWIIDQLDLVVTVDTSVAHLAGALGKPVWNLVRYDALWPWMQDKSATCWYDSMRIYRQVRPFDWSEPLKRVQNDLTALIEKRSDAAAA